MVMISNSEFVDSVRSAFDAAYAAAPAHLREQVRLRCGFFGGALYVQIVSWKGDRSEFSCPCLTREEASQLAWGLGSYL